MDVWMSEFNDVFPAVLGLHSFCFLHRGTVDGSEIRRSPVMYQKGIFSMSTG